MGARKSARCDVALVERRPPWRLRRLSGIDRDHLVLVAGRHRSGRRRHHHDCRCRHGIVGIPLSCPTLSRARRLRRVARAAAATHGDQVTCCSAPVSPASRCWARGDRSNGRRAGPSSSSPTRARFSREYTQISSALGAIVFPIIVGVVAGKFGRRITYAALCVGSILSCLLLYQGNDRFDGFFLFSIFLAGGITAGFYGLFPLYLPELFPTVVRATGQGFCVQLRPDSRRRRRPSDSDPHGVLRRKLSDGRVRADDVLRGRTDHYLARAGDTRQTAAGIIPNRSRRSRSASE